MTEHTTSPSASSREGYQEVHSTHVNVNVQPELPTPRLYRNQHPTALGQVLYNLTLHTPTPEVGALMDQVRDAYKQVATVVCITLPHCREVSLAMMALEESCMQAIAGLARAQGAEGS